MNVLFYKGHFRSPVGSIEELLKWKGSYHVLERNHEYIQWLFPNYFSSRFNPDADPLSRAEAREFRRDPEIAQKYFESYNLFLDFLGLELLDPKTGHIRRAPGGASRLRQALVENPHNQLRVRRILASLAITGFQRYMKPLVQHLDLEINGDGRLEPALRELQYTPDVVGTWRQYVDGDSGHFISNTKASEEDCEESVFFSQWLTRQQTTVHATHQMGVDHGGSRAFSVSNTTLPAVRMGVDHGYMAYHRGLAPVSRHR